MLVYDDALGPGWQSWSWGGEYDFAATDEVYDGAAAISARIEPWGALSLHHDEPFTEGQLTFWVEGDTSGVSLVLEADGEGISSDPVPLSEFVIGAPGVWDQVVVDLSRFGEFEWTRIDWFANGAAGAELHLDLIAVEDHLAGWNSLETVGVQRLAVWGDGTVPAAGEVSVDLDGLPIGVDAVVASEGRFYVELARALTPGNLVVRLPAGSFTRVLRADAVTLPETPTHRISPWVYGMAFAPDADYAREHGVTVVRWGGNATTLYNPAAEVTNLAADWYFENYGSGSAEDFVATWEAEGVAAFLSVPALGRVAADDLACGFSVAKYGAQQAVDPWRTDCGNGVRPDGSLVTGNDPDDHTVPWDETDAAAWVAGMSTPPTILAVGNELDIASSTHRDVHPDPVGYDELADTWYRYASALRAAHPGAVLAGPSSCCWWYYWNSAAGEADKAAHGGVDLLPWWLDEVAARDAAAGVRTLDLFDVHYYPDGVYNDDDDVATAERRLRSTRSLWDPTYTDEGWIGTDTWATQTQPSPNEVQLVPRMRALIDAHYPGTAFGLTEWNWGAEDELSGGLAVADVLGILGREGVDVATYWTAPEPGTPAAEAFRVYRSGVPFGDEALPVYADDADRLGVYAARTASGELTVVVVNKDPVDDLLLDLGELGDRVMTVTGFSAGSGGTLVDHGGSSTDGVVAVPAYAAFKFVLAVDGGEDTGTPPDGDDTATPDDTGGPDDGGGEGKDGEGGCGCGTGGPGRGAAGLALGVLLAARRRGAPPGGGGRAPGVRGTAG